MFTNAKLFFFCFLTCVLRAQVNITLYIKAKTYRSIEIKVTQRKCQTKKMALLECTWNLAQANPIRGTHRVAKILKKCQFYILSDQLHNSSYFCSIAFVCLVNVEE